jgi:hypothetical protein
VNRFSPRQAAADARALAALLILIISFIARADAQHLTLWTVKGEQNTVLQKLMRDTQRTSRVAGQLTLVWWDVAGATASEAQ